MIIAEVAAAIIGIAIGITLIFIVVQLLGNPARDIERARVLREQRDAKKKELDTLRSEHAKMSEVLEKIGKTAEANALVTDNLYAHEVLGILRKDK